MPQGERGKPRCLTEQAAVNDGRREVIECLPFDYQFPGYKIIAYFKPPNTDGDTFHLLKFHNYAGANFAVIDDDFSRVEIRLMHSPLARG
jgi:hypothetical protein